MVLRASTITRAALMAAVTAVAAQIAIPLQPVPFTLQVLAVILCGLLLGVRVGALAQAIYVLVGAAGLAANTVATAPRVRALLTGFLWGCAGLAVIYAFGATWLAVVSGFSPAKAIAVGILPFIAFDLIKVALATLVAVAAAPAISPPRT
jgi:biotin transport system substrate-specific component